MTLMSKPSRLARFVAAVASAGLGIGLLSVPPAAAANVPVSACNLFTKDELSAAFDFTLSDGTPSGVGCTFDSPTAFVRVNLQRAGSDSKDYFLLAQRQKRPMQKLKIGKAKAVYFPPLSGKSLMSEEIEVLAGNREFGISPGEYSSTQTAHKAALVALVRKAIPRLKG